MFAVPFHQIGQILGKSADATKMIASRARRKVQATDRPAGPGREHQEVIQAFRAAALSGGLEALLRVLDPNLKLTVDTPDGMVVTLGATEVAAGARMFSGEPANDPCWSTASPATCSGALTEALSPSPPPADNSIRRREAMRHDDRVCFSAWPT
ncbi:hypothetical protein ACIBI9_00610 [Nonomuraea sp. NPDC050451]|uniref:hypothetical protein n=1 Tax=Nonomuraea sp. NPDC050451 TaxID=3364364 RepID=UPI003795D73B